MQRIRKSCKLHDILSPVTFHHLHRVLHPRMVHCMYPGCDYKSLQKSNVVNHTHRQSVCPVLSSSLSDIFLTCSGFSKSYACPFSNCTYFTLYSRSLTEHMLSIHSYMRSPQGKTSKQSTPKPMACSSTGSNQLCLGPFRQEADKCDHLCILQRSKQDISLTHSSNLGDQQQSMHPVPAQLVPGYWHVPFYQNEFSMVLGDTRPTRYCYGAVNGAPVPSHAAIASQMPPAEFLSGTHDHLPMVHTFDFQGATSHPYSSFSSSISSLNLSDIISEIQHPLMPFSIEDLRLNDFHSSEYSSYPLSTAICAPGNLVPSAHRRNEHQTHLDRLRQYFHST